MTPTAKELIASPSFWIKRIEEQVEYIARFDNTERIQLDAYKIKFGAIDIMEVCQRNAIDAATTAFEKGIVSQIISDIGAPSQ